MSDDDLAALAALLRGAAGPGAEFLARTILESEWLREHDARVRREGFDAALDAVATRADDGIEFGPDNYSLLVRILRDVSHD